MLPGFAATAPRVIAVRLRFKNNRVVDARELGPGRDPSHDCTAGGPSIPPFGARRRSSRTAPLCSRPVCQPFSWCVGSYARWGHAAIDLYIVGATTTVAIVASFSRGSEPGSACKGSVCFCVISFEPLF